MQRTWERAKLASMLDHVGKIYNLAWVSYVIFDNLILGGGCAT